VVSHHQDGRLANVGGRLEARKRALFFKLAAQRMRDAGALKNVEFSAGTPVIDRFGAIGWGF